MGPMAQADGHDGPGLSLQLVPGVAAVVDESMEVIEHAVGEPVVADELPDVLLRVQLGHFGGNGTMVMLWGTTSFPERCHPA